VPVSYTQLVLGDEIVVPTLKGKVTCKIPSGTESGKKFRLKGLGLPIFNRRASIDKVGDQFVQVELEVPSNLTKRQEELIRELSELERKTPPIKTEEIGE